MTFDAWLTQFKPGDASVTVFVYLFLAFLVLKIWPWFTKEWWPAQQAFRKAQFEADQARDDATQKTLDKLAESMARLTVLVEQNISLTTLVVDKPTLKRNRKVSDATQPKRPRAAKKAEAA